MYIVTSPYFNGHLFGAYTSMTNARKAIKQWFDMKQDFICLLNEHDYLYHFKTKFDSTVYWMEIMACTPDDDIYEE